MPEMHFMQLKNIFLYFFVLQTTIFRVSNFDDLGVKTAQHEFEFVMESLLIGDWCSQKASLMMVSLTSYDALG